MKKLKNLYLHNSIIQFIVSYIIVLILPLIICTVGIQIALHVVENNLKESNMIMLEHSKAILESDLRLIRLTSEQIANNSVINKIATDKGTKNPQYYLDAKVGIQKVNNIVQSTGIQLLDGVKIYFKNSNYMMLDYSMYEGEFYFNKMLKDKRMTFEEWKEDMLKLNTQRGFYKNEGGILQFIRPIIDSYDTVTGAIICDIDTFNLNNLFSVGRKGIAEYFYIQDLGSNEIIYSTGSNIDMNDMDNTLFKDTKGTIKLKDKVVIYTFSSVEDWRYVLVIPEKSAMGTLHTLKLNLYLLIFLASGIGMFLAFYASIRQGKSLNEIFNIYISDEDITRDFKNLGEVVSKIATKNKKLISELENEKPLVRNAFFNKLIRGEVLNEIELKLLAEKAGCNITGSRYAVMVFRLFSNNDFYEIDSQTMEEVPIISRLIQDNIEKYLKKEVWFYEVDYLTTFIIFEESSSLVKGEDIVEFIKKEISQKYSVYPTWGMGNACTDLLELWRSCEEAKVALKSIKAEDTVSFIHYNEVVENQKGFYYPDLFEERLKNSVKTGDLYHINNLLQISKKENFEVRKIPRALFLKLNVKFINTITRLKTSTEVLKDIERINQFVIEYYEEPIDKYYDILEEVFIKISEDVEESKKSRRSILITKIMEFIHMNYRNPDCGLSMIATEFNISEAYVSTLFKEQTEVNFAAYVEKMRIDQACVLLQENSLSVGQVAEEVGYNSIQSFRRAFKKVKGFNPSELKK